MDLDVDSGSAPERRVIVEVRFENAVNVGGV